MQSTSLAAVLQRPDIWRGDALASAPIPTLSSGFAALDAELPGAGWPRGQLTELLHAQPGIGELSLLWPALARLSVAGDTVFMVVATAPGQPHAPAWAAAGLHLEPLRLVYPGNPRDALWAAVECLRCPAVAATVLWLEAAAPLPLGSLRRLQAAAGEGGGCAFLYRSLRQARLSSPAPLRLQLEPQNGQLQLTILKRRGPAARRPLLLAVPRPMAAERLKKGTYALAGALTRDHRDQSLATA